MSAHTTATNEGFSSPKLSRYEDTELAPVFFTVTSTVSFTRCVLHST
jgi:hypothetical protein